MVKVKDTEQDGVGWRRPALSISIASDVAEHEKERGREKDTQNQKQAPSSELSAQSLTQGLNSP